MLALFFSGGAGSKWCQDALKLVVIDFLHQGQQATDFSVWKSLAGKPVEIVARKVRDDCSLVFAERHDSGNQEFKMPSAIEVMGWSPLLETASEVPKCGEWKFPPSKRGDRNEAYDDWY